MNRKLIGAASLATLLIGAAAPSFAATILIDGFDDAQRVEDAPGLGQTTNNQFGVSGNILGGYRDLLVETDNLGQEDATGLTVQNSSLEFSNDTGVTGRGWVTYDGFNEVGDNPANVDTSGLGGLNFLIGPSAGFLFEIVDVDLPGIYIEIRAWDMFNNLVTYAEELPAGGGNPFVPFAAFGAGPFDWSQVGALQFFAQTGENSDVPALDGAIGSISISAVPVPSSVLFMLTGVAALGALVRRRRRTA